MPERSALMQFQDEDVAMLVNWARSPLAPAGTALRAHIVRASAESPVTSQVETRLGVSRPTVVAWRERYRAGGIVAPANARRSGRPKTVDQAKVIARAPKPMRALLGISRWWSRLLAAELGVGYATISHCWRRFSVQPSRGESFKFSTPTPSLRPKSATPSGVSFDSLWRAVVLCVDEKSQIRALDRSAPILPLLRGPKEGHPRLRPPRHDDPVRRLEAAAGQVTDACHERRRDEELLAFLKNVAVA